DPRTVGPASPEEAVVRSYGERRVRTLDLEGGDRRVDVDGARERRGALEEDQDLRPAPPTLDLVERVEERSLRRRVIAAELRGPLDDLRALPPRDLGDLRVVGRHDDPAHAS